MANFIVLFVQFVSDVSLVQHLHIIQQLLAVCNAKMHKKDAGCLTVAISTSIRFPLFNTIINLLLINKFFWAPVSSLCFIFLENFLHIKIPSLLAIWIHYLSITFFIIIILSKEIMMLSKFFFQRRIHFLFSNMAPPTSIIIRLILFQSHSSKLSKLYRMCHAATKICPISRSQLAWGFVTI